MTVAEFIKAIQEYYGQYPKGQQKYIVKYLSGITEEQLDLLFEYVIESFSSKYGKVPDIAIFTEQMAHVKYKLVSIQLGKEREEYLKQEEEKEKRRIEYHDEQHYDIPAILKATKEQMEEYENRQEEERKQKRHAVWVEKYSNWLDPVAKEIKDELKKNRD